MGYSVGPVVYWRPFGVVQVKVVPALAVRNDNDVNLLSLPAAP